MNKPGPSPLVIAFAVAAAISAQAFYNFNRQHHYSAASIALYCAVLFALYAIHAAIERTRNR